MCPIPAFFSPTFLSSFILFLLSLSWSKSRKSKNWLTSYQLLKMMSLFISFFTDGRGLYVGTVWGCQGNTAELWRTISSLFLWVCDNSDIPLWTDCVCLVQQKWGKYCNIISSIYHWQQCFIPYSFYCTLVWNPNVQPSWQQVTKSLQWLPVNVFKIKFSSEVSLVSQSRLSLLNVCWMSAEFFPDVFLLFSDDLTFYMQDTKFNEPVRVFTDEEMDKLSLQFYNLDVHRAAFAWPQFLRKVRYLQATELHLKVCTQVHCMSCRIWPIFLWFTGRVVARSKNSCNGPLRVGNSTQGVSNGTENSWPNLYCTLVTSTSLPLAIKYITRYEELGFSYLTQVKDNLYYQFSLLHLYISLWMVGRNVYSWNLGVEGLKVHNHCMVSTVDYLVVL